MTLKAYSNKRYGKLLASTLPAVIKSDGEYDRTEAIFNDLFNKGEANRSAEETRLFELLANLLEEYETRTLPRIEDASPAETLRFLMEENDLKQSDLDDVFGSQSVVSKVLSQQRSISKAHAKRLAERFNVSIDAFI
ncbi:MAG: helix-turn-helix domain-containing protein [Acidobacteriota bacterium]